MISHKHSLQAHEATRLASVNFSCEIYTSDKSSGIFSDTRQLSPMQDKLPMSHMHVVFKEREFHTHYEAYEPWAIVMHRWKPVLRHEKICESKYTSVDQVQKC